MTEPSDERAMLALRRLAALMEQPTEEEMLEGLFDAVQQGLLNVQWEDDEPLFSLTPKGKRSATETIKQFTPDVN